MALFYFFYNVLIYWPNLFLERGTHVSRHARGGHRKNCGDHFFPSSEWIQGYKLRCSGFVPLPAAPSCWPRKRISGSLLFQSGCEKASVSKSVDWKHKGKITAKKKKKKCQRDELPRISWRQVMRKHSEAAGEERDYLANTSILLCIIGGSQNENSSKART